MASMNANPYMGVGAQDANFLYYAGFNLKYPCSKERGKLQHYKDLVRSQGTLNNPKTHVTMSATCKTCFIASRANWVDFNGNGPQRMSESRFILNFAYGNDYNKRLKELVTERNAADMLRKIMQSNDGYTSWPISIVVDKFAEDIYVLSRPQIMLYPADKEAALKAVFYGIKISLEHDVDDPQIHALVDGVPVWHTMSISDLVNRLADQVYGTGQGQAKETAKEEAVAQAVHEMMECLEESLIELYKASYPIDEAPVIDPSPYHLNQPSRQPAIRVRIPDSLAAPPTTLAHDDDDGDDHDGDTDYDSDSDNDGDTNDDNDVEMGNSCAEMGNTNPPSGMRHKCTGCQELKEERDFSYAELAHDDVTRHDRCDCCALLHPYNGTLTWRFMHQHPDKELHEAWLGTVFVLHRRHSERMDARKARYAEIFAEKFAEYRHARRN